jgi:hypothetical protein
MAFPSNVLPSPRAIRFIARTHIAVSSPAPTSLTRNTFTSQRGTAGVSGVGGNSP